MPDEDRPDQPDPKEGEGSGFRSEHESRDDDPDEEREPRRQRLRERRRGRHGHVMHTRISEDLDDALRRAAGDMRQPVSNVVRNVLEDAFDIVESVTENLGGLSSLVEGVVGAQRIGDELRRARETMHRGVNDARREVRDRLRESRSKLRDARRDFREAQRSARETYNRARREHEHGERSERRSDRAREREVRGERDDVETSATRRDLPEFPDVLGWQPLVLNQPQECAGCGRALARGDRASLGISSEGRPAAYLCEECVSAV